MKYKGVWDNSERTSYFLGARMDPPQQATKAMAIILSTCLYVIYEVWGRGRQLKKKILNSRNKNRAEILVISVPPGIYKGRRVLSPELVGPFGGGRDSVFLPKSRLQQPLQEEATGRISKGCLSPC